MDVSLAIRPVMSDSDIVILPPSLVKEKNYQDGMLVLEGTKAGGLGTEPVPHT